MCSIFFCLEILNTIDYIDKTDGSLIFRTCSREKDKIIFQIGTSCPERAAKVAALMYGSVYYQFHV